MYAYAEGNNIDAARRMDFDGIPVLFIPGSGGSYKQARSLGSVLMRKAMGDHNIKFHFDVFTVDLNEEYSALYGGVLEQQTEFVRQAIYRILDLYQGSTCQRPNNVVLVGHSMGGLIAKGLFNSPVFDPSVVRVIFTFATPHSRPVIVFDEYIYRYYRTTSKTWLSGRPNKLKHVTLISVGGGHKDYLVQADSITSWEVDVYAVTTTIPTVWRSVDHLAILWCKELVLVTARALFDMVDPKAKQITRDRELRIRIASYHFLHRNRWKHIRNSHRPPAASVIEGVESEEPTSKQFSVSTNLDPEEKDYRNKPRHIMIHLSDLSQHTTLTAEAIHHPEPDWVFACQASVVVGGAKVCKNAQNLSNATMFWPCEVQNCKHKRIVLDLKYLHTERKFSHVILRMPAHKRPIQLHVDIHANRVLKPPPLGIWMLYDTRPVVLVEETSPKALRYVVDFSEVESLWHVMYLNVKPLSCQNKEHNAVSMLVIPWSNEKVFNVISHKNESPLLIRLLQVKPRIPKNIPRSRSTELNMVVQAEISLDPSCTYRISVEAAPGLLLSQFARTLTPCIFAYMVAILLLTLREQLNSMKETGKCSLFHFALSRGAKPFYILPLCKILSRILTQGDSFYSRLNLDMLGLPEPDMNMMSRLPVESLLYPFLLYMCAFGLVYLAGFLLMFAIVFNAKVMNGIALSFIGRYFKRSITSWISTSNLSDFVMEFMIRAPPVVVTLLMMISLRSCGALGLVLGGVYFYLVLCNMYSDYMEALLKYSMRVVAGKAKISLDGIANPGASTQSSSPQPSQSSSKKSSVVKEDAKAVVEPKGDLKKGSTTPKIGVVKDAKNEDEDAQEEERNSLSDINVHMTVFLIYVTAVVSSIPSLLTWAHNYNYDRVLFPDPTFTPFVLIMCGVSVTFWLHVYPDPQLPCYRIVMEMLFGLATFTLLYAPVRISFIPYIIAGVMGLLASHQWLTALHLYFFPSDSDDVVDSDNDSDADSINDHNIDSSHSATDDEVADGDDEGGESGSDCNEDTNETRKVFAINKIAKAHRPEANDDSSDAESDHIAGENDSVN